MKFRIDDVVKQFIEKDLKNKTVFPFFSFIINDVGALPRCACIGLVFQRKVKKWK